MQFFLHSYLLSHRFTVYVFTLLPAVTSGPSEVQYVGYYLRRGDYVFMASVCLCVCKIFQKVMNEFWRNFCSGEAWSKNQSVKLIAAIRITIRIQDSCIRITIQIQEFYGAYRAYGRCGWYRDNKTVVEWMSNEWPMRMIDNELFFSFIYFTVYTSFRIIIWFGYFIVKSMAWCLCCKLICYLFIVYGNGDGDGDGASCMRGWMGTGTILKLVAGIGMRMGIRVPEMVGDGYKHLSPCSSLG